MQRRTAPNTKICGARKQTLVATDRAERRIFALVPPLLMHGG